MAIAARFGVDGNAVLDNIIVARAYTHETQIQLLTLLAAKLAEEGSKRVTTNINSNIGHHSFQLDYC